MLSTKKLSLGFLGSTSVLITLVAMHSVITKSYFPYIGKTADNTYNVEMKKVETQHQLGSETLMYQWKRDSIYAEHKNNQLEQKVEELNSDYNSLSQRVNVLEQKVEPSVNNQSKKKQKKPACNIYYVNINRSDNLIRLFYADSQGNASLIQRFPYSMPGRKGIRTGVSAKGEGQDSFLHRAKSKNRMYVGKRRINIKYEDREKLLSYLEGQKYRCNIPDVRCKK